jgi:starch synthase (maltosyl-transferring)
LRHWAIDRADSLKGLITRVNRIRRQNPALQANDNLRFHAVDNEEIICYSKHTEDRTNIILVVVNVDPHHTQSGLVTLDPEALDLKSDESYQVHDLLGDARYLWHSSQNYVELNPAVMPAQIFHVRRRVRTERDFDYFL